MLKFLQSPAMNRLDWALALISLGYTVYLYTQLGPTEQTGWWAAATALGFVFAYVQPAKHIQGLVRQRMLRGARR